MRDYYLVQRMVREDSHRDGFDGKFRGEYMGSSEFEWGALPRSLKEMRKHRRKIEVRPELVAHEKYVRLVYFVSSVPVDMGAFEAWMVGGCYGKERSEFDDAFHYRGSGGSVYPVEANLWWALNENIMWALDPQIAEDACLAVRGK